MKRENRTLEVLLKVFLVVGIVAGICVIVKIIYDKYKQKLCLICDEDCDCDFECLENDALDCDCWVLDGKYMFSFFFFKEIVKLSQHGYTLSHSHQPCERCSFSASIFYLFIILVSQ